MLSPEQLPIVLILGYLIAPLFLILPLVISCVIAAEAFVGEKERKTLEALLYTRPPMQNCSSARRLPLLFRVFPIRG